LLLAVLILAECVYVLESFYEVKPRRAELMRSAIALNSITTTHPELLLRARTRDPWHIAFLALRGQKSKFNNRWHSAS
jgi:hypothetical protein